MKTRPRPIVVGFVRTTEKASVFKNLSNLKGCEKWNGVYVGDDYTECQRNQIRDLRALSAYTRRLGHDSIVRNHYLWIDNKRYVYEDHDRLPPGVTFESVKTLEVLDGKGLAFQSSHSPLSNLYPCNVCHRGESFLSSDSE